MGKQKRLPVGSLFCFPIKEKLRGYGSFDGLGNPLFHTGSFTLTTTEVKQPGTAYFAQAHYVDFVNVGRQQGENSLHANAVGNFAYRKRLAARVWVTALDYCAGEKLNTLFGTFTYFNVYIDRITGPEYG